MELVQTVVTSVVMVAVGGLVAWTTTGQFRSLHRELDARSSAVDQRFDVLDRRIERIEGSLDGLRSDLTQIALAVEARPRAQNG